MTKRNRKIIWDALRRKYGSSIWIHTGTKDGEFYSRIVSREIVVPQSSDASPDEWDLFAFLHELGHVLTNNPKMRRCEMEYYATQWALDEAKRLGFYVSKEIIDVYQKYIFGWMRKGSKAKKVLTENDLRLVC